MGDKNFISVQSLPRSASNNKKKKKTLHLILTYFICYVH